MNERYFLKLGAYSCEPSKLQKSKLTHFKKVSRIVYLNLAFLHIFQEKEEL